MTKFVEDLREVSCSAAKSLRGLAKSKEPTRLFREQRSEAQFVAEVYHRLLSKGYRTDQLFMEYSYTKGRGNKRLKPDLIYEQNHKDEVVEFKGAWENDLKKNSTEANEHPRKTVRNTVEKLKNFKVPGQDFASLSMVLAYLGPESLEGGVHFDLDVFRESIGTAQGIERLTKSDKEVPLEIILC